MLKAKRISVLAALAECKAAQNGAGDGAEKQSGGSWKPEVFSEQGENFGLLFDALTLRVASCRMKRVGRLAQRLEHSAYTRKVVRSNRTLPTTSDIYPPRGRSSVG